MFALIREWQTQTRWSPERDSWEVRLVNPHGIEVARMSWRAWQQLSANRPFNSGPNLPNDLLPEDLYLAAVSARKHRLQWERQPKARLTIVGDAL